MKTRGQIRTGNGQRLRAGALVACAAGWVMMTLALTALAYELLAFYHTGGYRMVPAGEFWFAVDVASLNLSQAIIQRYVHPFLWDPIIAGLLQWPAWSLLGGPGVVLAFGFPIRRA